MKTTKVFLASSDELKDERQKFGNLIRQLDDIFIKRDIHILLLAWAQGFAEGLEHFTVDDMLFHAEAKKLAKKYEFDQYPVPEPEKDDN